MLTLILTLVETIEQAPHVDPFIRMPSLFTIVDMVGTTLLAVLLWRLYRLRKTSANGTASITTRQHERISKRMVDFEAAQSAMSEHLHAMEHSALEAAKRHQENWIMLRDTSEQQLEVLRSLKSVVERSSAKMTHVAKTADDVMETLNSRPCLLGVSGSAECPEGHHGDKE